MSDGGAWGRLLGHALVERHFAGASGAWDDRRMWRHLRGCERCRTRYRAQAMLEALAPAGGEHARARLGRALLPPRRALVPWLAAPTALAAGLALWLVVPRAPAPDDGFTARSSSTAAAAHDATPTITLFRLPPAGRPERAGAVVHADDALLFAYDNPPEAAYRYLMIFARDDAGRIYWYWPAWRDPATRPTAMPIAPAAAPVELREAVKHPLAPGGLTLTALFTQQPHDVVAVEAAAAQGEAGLRALGGRLVRERVEVLP